MKQRVVITGRGIISSLGTTPGELHTALCEGRSGLNGIEMFDTEGLKCKLGGEIRSFSAKTFLGERNLRPLDRTSQLVASAAQLALDDSGWSMEMRAQQEVGIVLGTMFCNVQTIIEFDRSALVDGPCYVSPMDFANTVINAAAGQTAIRHNLRGVNTTIATGSTSGLQAIAYATELIRSERATAILSGGADVLCFESFLGFERAGWLCGSNGGAGSFPIPFDVRRNGLAQGEGAALLMLESLETAEARGANILAEIKGYGSGYDYLRNQSDAQAIAAIIRSIRLALQDAQVPSNQINCLSASANGSIHTDRYEATAVAAIRDDKAQYLPVTAIKSMLGETLGASGAIQVVDLLESMQDGVLPGIAQLEQTENDFPLKMASSKSQEIHLETGLVNSVGLDGHCCSLIVGRA